MCEKLQQVMQLLRSKFRSSLQVRYWRKGVARLSVPGADPESAALSTPQIYLQKLSKMKEDYVSRILKDIRIIKAS